MAATSCDAIVVGAGLSGLGVAAILAGDGRRVVVLEQARHVGGRAHSRTVRGHVVNFGGPHAGIEGAKVDELFARAGRAPGERGFFEGTLGFEHGEFFDLQARWMEGSLDELADLVPVVVAMGDEELARLDAVAADEWVREHVESPELAEMLRFTGIVFNTLPRLSDLAASTLVEALRTALQMPRTCLAAHGYGDFMEILAEAATARGAELRTRAKVERIAIEDSRVQGVVVRSRDGKEGEEIRAPVVVVAFPVWDLFEVAPETAFVPCFVDQVRNLDCRTAIFGVTAALHEPLYPGRQFILADAPRAGYPFAGFMSSNVAPSLSPEGEHLFEACCICDADLGRDRARLAAANAALTEDLEEMFLAIIIQDKIFSHPKLIKFYFIA